MSTSIASHIQATQDSLDTTEEALRDADDALSNIECADDEGECAAESVAQFSAALDTAEEALRKTRACFQKLCAPREAPAT